MVQNTVFVCDFSSLVMLSNTEFIGEIRYFTVAFMVYVFLVSEETGAASVGDIKTKICFYQTS